ncbi:MAG: porphobilinogen synthase [Bdellovibrionales bacterium]
MFERPRRLRKSGTIRSLVQETELSADQLIWPVFIKEGQGQRDPIASLPGCARLSADLLIEECGRWQSKGLKAIALFPAIDDKLKDSKAREAVNPDGLVPRVVRELKKHYPDLTVITDVALDPYSSDGHDGLVKNGIILNDETLLVLAEQALTHAQAGADFVGPSDMMDGRVGWIREKLDEAGFQQTGIISYTAKYASAFYGPFRDALGSAPKSGDKKTYQMDPRNRIEAKREARLDRGEGADILMVKPALAYLDVIADLARDFDLPIAAYNVSGEYAMVKAAAQAGWLNEKAAVLEILHSIRRAGARMILSYHTPDVLTWLGEP